MKQEKPCAVAEGISGNRYPIDLREAKIQGCIQRGRICPDESGSAGRRPAGEDVADCPAGCPGGGGMEKGEPVCGGSCGIVGEASGY